MPRSATSSKPLTLIISTVLSLGVTLHSPRSMAQSGEGCNTVALQAADQAGNGKGLALALLAGGLALMGVMMAACSATPPVNCPTATTAFMGYQMVNGTLPMLAGTSQESGMVSQDALNSAGDCTGEGMGGVGDFGTFDGPAQNFCSTPGACGCTGAANDPPFCTKEKWSKYGGQLKSSLDELRNSNLGDGVDKQELINGLESALADFNATSAAFTERGLDEVASFDAGHGSERSASSSGGGSYNDENGSESSSTFGRAGPADKSGLGAAYAANGLQLFDRNTDKEFSIWQRATRRYQGSPSNKRGVAMARLEFLRGNAKKLASAAAKKSTIASNGGSTFKKEISATAVPVRSPKKPSSDPKAVPASVPTQQ